MGNTFSLFYSDLVGDDGQARVQLHGIAIDDFTVVFEG
jgi:hypothetical protein